ncbi:MAG: response regulator [Gammaproteobacteria bacterium]
MPNNAPFDPRAMLELVMESVSADSRTLNVPVRLNLSPELPQTIDGDAALFQRTLVHICRYALRSAEEGDVRLIVDAEMAIDGSRKINCTVDVTQSIISAKALLALLDGDEAAEDAHIEGLADAHRATRLMGGQLSVCEAHGSGVQFSLSVPATGVPGNAQLAAPSPTERISAEGVLVADDNAVSRDLLVNALDAMGLSATVVNSGQAAEAAFQERQASGKPIQVLITDWRMPDQDGITTAARIRDMLEPGQALFVIMVSAYTEDADQTLAESDGVIDAILPKPVETQALHELLARFLPTEPVSEDISASSKSAAQVTASRRVLIADECRITRMISQEALATPGMTLEEVEDAEAMFKQLRTTPFDLIIIDRDLPGARIPEMLTELGAGSPNQATPVIVMSSNESPEADDWYGADVSGFISKPFDPSDLVGLVHATLAARRNRSGATPADEGASSRQDRPGIDQALALRYASGNQALMERLLERFLRTRSGVVSSLTELLAEGRRAEATSLAHALKSESGGIAAKKVHEAASNLEQALRSEQDWSGPLNTLEAAMAEVLAPLSTPEKNLP